MQFNIRKITIISYKKFVNRALLHPNIWKEDDHGTCNLQWEY